MPYPDNFNGINMDASYQPEKDCPDAHKRVMEDQAVYNECLIAFTTILQKHRRAFLTSAIESAMECIGEALWEDSEREIKELADNQYDITSYPEGRHQLCENASEQLFDAMRVKHELFRYDLPKPAPHVDPAGSKFRMSNITRQFNQIINDKSEGGAA